MHYTKMNLFTYPYIIMNFTDISKFVRLCQNTFLISTKVISKFYLWESDEI